MIAKSVMSALLLAAVLAAPDAASARRAVTAEQPWIRATPPGAKAAAGYVILSNAGPAADRLLRAASPAAQKVAIHRSVETGGVMRMIAIPDLAVPAGAKVALAPGGYHLMLTGLKGPLASGQTVAMTLTFEHAGPVKVTFAVRAAAPGPHAGAHSH